MSVLREMKNVVREKRLATSHFVKHVTLSLGNLPGT
jgi:hypothetical protein